MYEYQVVANTLVPVESTLVEFERVSEMAPSTVLRCRFKVADIRPEDAFVEIVRILKVRELALIVEKEWPGLSFEPADAEKLPDDLRVSIYTLEDWKQSLREGMR